MTAERDDTTAVAQKLAPVGILARADAMTRLLGEQGPLAPADLAERTGTPRASVYRLIEALNAIGLTETRAGGQAALSLRWLRLADAASAAMTEWSGAEDVLAELAGRTGQTAFLSVPRGRAAVCVRWVPGSGLGVLVLRPGRSLPLHAGAAGRMCLAHRHDLAAVLADAPYEAFTDATLTTADELAADVTATLERGYSISDEDVTVGIGALGAAVRGARDELVAVVSMGGLAEDFRSGRTRFADALLAAAGDLTAGLVQARAGARS